jgi:hypothetical protein
MTSLISSSHSSMHTLGVLFLTTMPRTLASVHSHCLFQVVKTYFISETQGFISSKLLHILAYSYCGYPNRNQLILCKMASCSTPAYINSFKKYSTNNKLSNSWHVQISLTYQSDMWDICIRISITPYRISILQELLECDKVKCLQFCMQFLELQNQ